VFAVSVSDVHFDHPVVQGLLAEWIDEIGFSLKRPYFRTVCRAYRLTTCRLSIYRGVMEFRTPSYFALASLIDGPLHGYAMVRRAAELSDGAVRLSTGTLYALLERAMDEGLVVAGEPYLEGGRQRRDYALTQDGRRALQAEAEQLARAARTVTRRLRVSARTVAE
jgi:PadR family transcriptional regulator, regulatory protein PadR